MRVSTGVVSPGLGTLVGVGNSLLGLAFRLRCGSSRSLEHNSGLVALSLVVVVS